MLLRMRIIFLIYTTLLWRVTFSKKPNNVCPTIRDYFTMQNNSKCWYDFAAESTVPEIIQKTGYPLIQYKVQTEDGFQLSMFRIPGFDQHKPPVFMLHGVQSTSGIFVGLGKRSIAFQLSDAGYDVWLGNYRGTEYSEGHESLNVTDKAFWDHSVDEIALYDVPAMLQLIQKHTDKHQKAIYIGHSLASTAAMMFASDRPKTAKSLVSLFIFVGPAYKMTHMRSPYRMFFPLFYPALDVTANLNLVQVFSRGYSRRLSRPTCLASPVLMMGCSTLVNMFVGPFSDIAPETIPVYFNQLPGGTSLKTLTFLRESTRGNFRKFDYGAGKNSFVYGSRTPPEYDIKKIEVPIFIIYARSDWATTKQDAILLYKELPESIKAGIYGVEKFNFNHNDYFFGKSSDELITKPIMKVIENFIKKQKENTPDNTENFQNNNV